MSGLPRQYAKMGFSRGWKAYKQSKSSRSTRSTGETMRRKARSSARSGGFKRFARRTAHRAGIGKSVQLFQMDAMIYGGVRQYASDAIAKTGVTNMIPLGGLADEVAMGALCYFTAKNTNGMISDIAKKGLIIENARVGEALVQGGFGGILSGGASTTTNTVPLLG